MIALDSVNPNDRVKYNKRYQIQKNKVLEVIPAILEKDFAEIEKKIRLVEGLVNWVQIDCANDTLVPNATFLDPAPFALLSTSIKLEAHLMVKDPLRFVENFAKAGFKRFFAHVEADYTDEFIEKCRQLGVEVGLAIDGPTPLEKIKGYMDKLDVVLVMAIKAGFSGQPYREETAERIKDLRMLDADIPIAVDGAMDDINAAKVVAAGATRINSNSFIFHSEDVKMAIDKLKMLGEKPL
ncbi:hypothetical protein M1271_02475 [Patescibacteria group bacterium]|nr:hypothetical protein [Patescibacteria group bacterium]MCL5797646.1 hypothetical protein [Patescibacteria group bacterium]